MVLTTKFDMLQRVTINELKTPARVMGIRYDGLGIVYQLEYWMNGEIKVVNLYEDEVTQGDRDAAERKTAIGYVEGLGFVER